MSSDLSHFLDEVLSDAIEPIDRLLDLLEIVRGERQLFQSTERKVRSLNRSGDAAYLRFLRR